MDPKETIQTFFHISNLANWKLSVKQEIPSAQQPTQKQTRRHAHTHDPRGWDFYILLMKFLKIRHPYLSKTPFANGPQNLKMVKVDCKRKWGKERNRSDLLNLARVLESSPYIPTRVFQTASGFNCIIFAMATLHHYMDTSQHILFPPPQANTSPVGI